MACLSVTLQRPSNQAHKGTRVDHLIARILHIGVRTLLEVRRRGIIAPKMAGRKAANSEDAAAADEEIHQALAADQSDFGPRPRLVMDLATTNDPAQRRNLEVGLSLGRMIFGTLSSNMPLRDYTKQVLRAFMSGADVGQLHHDYHAVESLCHTGANLVRAGIKEDIRRGLFSQDTVRF